MLQQGRQSSVANTQPAACQQQGTAHCEEHNGGLKWLRKSGARRLLQGKGCLNMHVALHRFGSVTMPIGGSKVHTALPQQPCQHVARKCTRAGAHLSSAVGKPHGCTAWGQPPLCWKDRCRSLRFARPAIPLSRCGRQMGPQRCSRSRHCAHQGIPAGNRNCQCEF